MEKLRDMIYNKSDIIIALLIIIIAGIIIWTRVDSIMAYSTPEPRTTGATEDIVSSDSFSGDATTYGSVTSESVTSGSVTSDSGVSKVTNVSMYIGNGENTNTIAQKMLDAKLVNSTSEFLTAVSSANAESKLKSGTFIIPRGSTPAEIVAILTS